MRCDCRVCTWLSYDGGVSWSEVGSGVYIYEFADWGGVVVAARHPGKLGTPADEVLVSMDYGRCWQVRDCVCLWLTNTGV